ncbi:MAG: endonuclease/exonuclease/phosphatase family protein [Lautropia sp.]
MIIVTWNIQWCKGCDDVVDPRRIVDTARALGDFDVLCLQEVADNFPELVGSAGENQFRLLADLLPGFEAVEGVAVDRLGPNGRRQRFGNLMLSRLPVLSVWRHLLPWPVDPATPGMQRIALEAVLGTDAGPLRVTTTHLEYFSAIQREAQVKRLLALQAEACAHAPDALSWRGKPGPFQPQPRPPSGILTADFNFRVEDPLYARIQSEHRDPHVPPYRDAWAIAHPGVEHAATLGIHDRKQWKESYACDFLFVTEDLASRVRTVRVDQQTDASDHQPVLLELAARH